MPTDEPNLPVQPLPELPARSSWWPSFFARKDKVTCSPPPPGASLQLYHLELSSYLTLLCSSGTLHPQSRATSSACSLPRSLLLADFCNAPNHYTASFAALQATPSPAAMDDADYPPNEHAAIERYSEWDDEAQQQSTNDEQMNGIEEAVAVIMVQLLPPCCRSIVCTDHQPGICVLGDPTISLSVWIAPSTLA